MNKRQFKKQFKKNLFSFAHYATFFPKLKGESTITFNEIAICLLKTIATFYMIDAPIFAAMWNTKKYIFIRVQLENRDRNIITLKFRNIFPFSFPFEKYFFNICEELYLQVNLKDIELLQVDLNQKGNNRKNVPIYFSFDFPKNRTLFYFLESDKSCLKLKEFEVDDFDVF